MKKTFKNFAYVVGEITSRNYVNRRRSGNGVDFVGYREEKLFPLACLKLLLNLMLSFAKLKQSWNIWDSFDNRFDCNISKYDFSTSLSASCLSRLLGYQGVQKQNRHIQTHWNEKVAEFFPKDTIQFNPTQFHKKFVEKNWLKFMAPNICLKCFKCNHCITDMISCHTFYDVVINNLSMLSFQSSPTHMANIQNVHKNFKWNFL